MNASAWILVVVMQGWGAGEGSAGNAVSMAEFSSEQTCSAASDWINKQVSRYKYARCFRK